MINSKFGKRGQLFALYLVLLTLFMCVLVVGIYKVQQRDTEALLVSPYEVLRTVDNEEIFALNEEILIKKSALEVDWGIEKFSEKVHDKFCEYFLGVDGTPLREFIFEDYAEGGKVASNAFDSIESQRNFCNTKYNFLFNENVLLVERNFSKSSFLIPKGDKKWRFIVQFDYDYKKKYLISEDDLN